VRVNEMNATPNALPSIGTGVDAAVEYVRSLPPEEKEAVFTELAREAIRRNDGRGLIPIATRDGESLGYYMTPAAADEFVERTLPKLSPEREAEIERRLAIPGQTIRAEYLLAELRSATPHQSQSQ
jgi:hypothetical protein